jgi:hypothetical protein
MCSEAYRLPRRRKAARSVGGRASSFMRAPRTETPTLSSRAVNALTCAL